MDEVHINTTFRVHIADVDNERKEIIETKTDINLRFKSDPYSFRIRKFCQNEPDIAVLPRSPGVWEYDMSNDTSITIRYQGSPIVKYTYNKECSAKKLATKLKQIEFSVENTMDGSIEETFTASYRLLGECNVSHDEVLYLFIKFQ